MKKIIMFILLVISSIFIYGCSQFEQPTEGVPDYLVFKTVELDYSNYLWGTRSIHGDDEWFWGGTDLPPLSETLAPLNEGYHFRVGVYSDKIAFFEKSFRQAEWRKVPDDETLKEEREKLIIKEPFTEFFVCSHEFFDIHHLKSDLGLYGDDLINHIKDEINKMIEEETLPQNCEKKV